MEESPPETQVRRRRSSGQPRLPLSLDPSGQVTDGAAAQGSPSPSCIKFNPSCRGQASSSAAQNEFRKKQQSFDVQEIQIEECEEEEITLDSDDEGDDPMERADRPVTPNPIQDFGATTTYTDGAESMQYLKVGTLQEQSVTDVSDAESEEE